MYKELILVEPCLCADLDPSRDLTHILDPVHIGLTTCCQLLAEPTYQHQTCSALVVQEDLWICVSVTEGIAPALIEAPSSPSLQEQATVSAP